jgi:putative 4-mercaptohistidine N1-methyltranferase
MSPVKLLFAYSDKPEKLRPSMTTPLYETPRLLSEYLLFHYGSDAELIAHPSLPREALHFAVRSVTELLPEDGSWGSALDVGCAVGRSSFELSKLFREVQATDFSHSFVQAAETLRQGNRISYQRHEEAARYTTLEAVAPAEAQLDRVHFFQGDAMHLPEALGPFDLVHAANLICRLTEPQLFLRRLPELVRPGGHLLVTTPCTWLEEFTPSVHWPKGETLAWLKEALEPHFTLEVTKDLPFLIREHARKYQHTIAQGSRWRRN